MGNPTKIRHGQSSTMPQASASTKGELKFTVDDGKLYFDDGIHNLLVGILNPVSSSDITSYDMTASGAIKIDNRNIELKLSEDAGNIATINQTGLYVRDTSSNRMFDIKYFYKEGDYPGWIPMYSDTFLSVTEAVAPTFYNNIKSQYDNTEVDGGTGEKVSYVDHYIINGVDIPVTYYNGEKIKIIHGSFIPDYATILSHLGYFSYFIYDESGLLVYTPKDSKLYSYMYIGDSYNAGSYSVLGYTPLASLPKDISNSNNLTDITIDLVERNSNYILGTITSLSLASVPSYIQETNIYFTSGSSFSFNAPDLVDKWLNIREPNFEVNVSYVITIKNGYAEYKAVDKLMTERANTYIVTNNNSNFSDILDESTDDIIDLNGLTVYMDNITIQDRNLTIKNGTIKFASMVPEDEEHVSKALSIVNSQLLIIDCSILCPNGEDDSLGLVEMTTSFFHIKRCYLDWNILTSKNGIIVNDDCALVMQSSEARYMENVDDTYKELKFIVIDSPNSTASVDIYDSNITTASINFPGNLEIAVDIIGNTDPRVRITRSLIESPIAIRGNLDSASIALDGCTFLSSIDFNYSTNYPYETGHSYLVDEFFIVFDEGLQIAQKYKVLVDYTSVSIETDLANNNIEPIDIGIKYNDCTHGGTNALFMLNRCESISRLRMLYSDEIYVRNSLNKWVRINPDDFPIAAIHNQQEFYDFINSHNQGILDFLNYDKSEGYDSQMFNLQNSNYKFINMEFNEDDIRSNGGSWTFNEPLFNFTNCCITFENCRMYINNVVATDIHPFIKCTSDGTGYRDLRLFNYRIHINNAKGSTLTLIDIENIRYEQSNSDIKIQAASDSVTPTVIGMIARSTINSPSMIDLYHSSLEVSSFSEDTVATYGIYIEDNPTVIPGINFRYSDINSWNNSNSSSRIESGLLLPNHSNNNNAVFSSFSAMTRLEPDNNFTVWVLGNTYVKDDKLKWTNPYDSNNINYLIVTADTYTVSDFPDFEKVTNYYDSSFRTLCCNCWDPINGFINFGPYGDMNLNNVTLRGQLNVNENNWFLSYHKEGFDTQGNVKGALDNIIDQLKPIIYPLSGATQVITLEHFKDFRCTEGAGLTSLDITVPAEINDDFSCSIVFFSGTTPTQFSVTGTIKFSGDDVTGGVLVPVASTTYNLLFWYDGFNMNCVTRGA